MKKLFLEAGNEVIFHDSIQEMPMLRFHTFNTNLAQDHDTGSTWQALERHRHNVIAFLSSGKQREAINEMENMSIGLWIMLEKISTTSVALAALVYSIDGVRTPLIPTDDSLLETSRVLAEGGITPAQVEEVIDELKKKLMLN